MTEPATFTVTLLVDRDRVAGRKSGGTGLGVTGVPPNTSAIMAPTTTTTLPAVPVDHVCYEWLPAMLEAGWPADPDILATGLTIMWRESRCTPTADSGPDHGLMQINRYWCKPSRYSAAGWLQIGRAHV